MNVGNLPPGDNKVWTFRKTTTFLTVRCNGVVIVTLEFSNLENQWRDSWSFDSKHIKISNDDDATAAYAITYAGL